MRSGSNSSRELDSSSSSSSLEIALDQAIAHRFSTARERSDKKRRNSPVPTSLALTVTSKETALALVPSRLVWRGIEVSDEFQEYAARVARGEQLAPYRGAVLSRACPEFPWGTPSTRALTAPTPTLREYPKRGRALETTLCLLAAVGSVVGALSLGAGGPVTGATNDIAETYQATAALTPSPPIPPKAIETPSPAELESTAQDDALTPAAALPEPSTPAVAPDEVKALAPAAPPRPARAPNLVRPPEVRATVPAETSPSASRLTIPPLTPPTAATSSRNAHVPATPAPAPSLRDTTLFSDKPSF
jgi:hypothetical protein